MRYGGILKEPDESFSPIQLKINQNILDNGYGSPFPNLVIEIAHQNESLISLQEELAAWIGIHTSVQIAVGIKIFVHSANGTRRLLAHLYKRFPNIQSVEFGTNLSNHNGLSLRFPLSDLYYGITRNEIPDQIDLDELNNLIMMEFDD
jgi:hypothetical protein